MNSNFNRDDNPDYYRQPHACHMTGFETNAYLDVDEHGSTANNCKNSTTDENQSENKRDQMCAICWEDMEVGGTTTIKKCSHKFHYSCISKWMNKQNTCPLCRLYSDFPLSDSCFTPVYPNE
ncbi:peroxisome biogenesis factor 10-like [Papaver somniferum]|uniref:peroxisome biogenesis factor 10-like n=1 Tax=Papaver somniferum TaxID=3469 RepID=UPI000E705356|nr:peroxisome biogenesis factor 10-like [Papaver somniferum]